MSMPTHDVDRWAGQPGAAHPAGMNTQPTTVAASRIHGFLKSEPVVWLSTVRPDGGPHLVPIASRSSRISKRRTIASFVVS